MYVCVVALLLTFARQLNMEMLGAMEARRADWQPETSTLGDVFTRYGPLFKMYGPYCAGLGDAFSVVKRCVRCCVSTHW